MMLIKINDACTVCIVEKIFLVLLKSFLRILTRPGKLSEKQIIRRRETNVRAMPCSFGKK